MYKRQQQYNASGVYENSVFPGIFDLFDALKANGVKIGLVTAKPEAATQLVIEHFKLAPYFDLSLIHIFFDLK